MELYINTGVRILVEDGNFTLQTSQVRKGGKNEGELYWKLRGYYVSLPEALANTITKGVISAHGRDAARVRLFITMLLRAQEEMRRAAGDFMGPQEASGLEGEVVGDVRHNVWESV